MAIRRTALRVGKGHPEIKLIMRYLSTLSLALIVHVLLSIGVLMALACTVTPAAREVSLYDIDIYVLASPLGKLK
ncbi:MAG: hypothetical protein FI737_10710 [SAR202 cluster bacterium]|jgi:hypothetical protein|nr:hypothetical protein [SAR202 cluster bacterium]